MRDLLIVAFPSFMTELLLSVSESLLTFLPAILIKFSLKVSEIEFGDLESTAPLFGFELTRVECA